MKVVGLSNLHTGRLYAPENMPGTYFYLSSRAIVRPEVLCQWKICNDTIGNRTRGLRLVAQCLNQLRHRTQYV
jgi:hypothetical protein